MSSIFEMSPEEAEAFKQRLIGALPPTGNLPDRAPAQTADFVDPEEVASIINSARGDGSAPTGAAGLMGVAGPQVTANKEQKQDEQKKYADITNKMMDSDELKRVSDVYRSSPEGLALNSGVERLKNLMQAQLSRPHSESMLPAAKVASYVTGQDFTQGVKPPMNQDEIAGQIFKYEDELQKRREAAAKGITDYLKASKEGGSQQLADTFMLQNLMKEGVSPKAMQNAMMFRTLSGQHQRVLSRLANDKDLSNQFRAFSGLGKALSIIAHADTVTPQDIAAAQVEAVRAIQQGTGGQSIGDERTIQYMRDLGLDWANVKQFLTGNPQDYGKNSELAKQIRQKALIEQENLATLYNQRLNAISGGNGYMYDDPTWGPIFKPSFESAIGGYKAMMPAAGPTKMRAPVAHKAPPGDMVPVFNPQGKAGYVPRAKLEEKLKAGYKKR